MTRLMMPRAGRPVIRLVSAVPSSRAALERGAVRREIFASGQQQVGGADLHARRAERERRRDAARIGDAAGRDHRHLHRIDDLRHQRERADLRRPDSSVRNMPRWPPASTPCAMIASTPRASSQRASATVVAELDHQAAGRLDAPQQRGVGRPKWKLTTSGFSSSTSVAERGVERRAVARRHRRGRIDAELARNRA